MRMTHARTSPRLSRARVRLFHLNGTDHAALVADNVLLLDYLREAMGLTGTKRGCDGGECGACTVLIDGEPRNACITLAASCEGRRIETIESLASHTGDGRMSRLQQAFHEKLGTQCGFCTPGMIMAAESLLRHHPAPDEAQIREALSGNLCGCAEAGTVRPAAVHGHAVGQRTPLIDGIEKVTGRARYTADLSVADALVGRILRSPIAHGRIRAIDTTKARALPGVRAVITGKDFAAPYGVIPIAQNEWPLARGTVRYRGEPVAAVAAVDEATAQAALAAIELDI